MKKIFPFIPLFFVFALGVLCLVFNNSVSAATVESQPEQDIQNIVTPELLEEVRQASEKFQFCFKSDSDIMKLFDEHFPQYDSTDYKRFFVSIPTGSITFYFIPNDCTFSGTASVMRFDKPCLRLVYGLTSQTYVANIIQPTTYFSSGNSFFRNADILIDDAVALQKNIDYFYSVNVAPSSPGETALKLFGQDYIYPSLLLILFAVLLLVFGKFVNSFSV